MKKRRRQERLEKQRERLSEACNEEQNDIVKWKEKKKREREREMDIYLN